MKFTKFCFITLRNFCALTKNKISMAETINHRLPRSVIPINYNLTLCPNFDNWTFKGSEIIELSIKEPTNKVLINSAEIVIQSAKYNETESAKIEYDTEMERAILSFPQNVAPGSGKLELQFSGILNDNMKGFYKSTYKDDHGNEVKMAVTQFEASDARRAFPCFDEPNFKATFNVNLIVPSSKVALSNMPVKSQTSEGDMTKYEYERTPVMSTYILAFVVGDMDYVEGVDANGVKIRVYAQKNKAERGRFALDVCVKTLPFYAQYFGIKYPLPKMDLVAIPDFAAGAMENWGLVTFREAMLLIDENQSSTSTRITVALVVGHEAAHMWFGNLVTMDWWTDLWLNEGFATWIEYLCVDYCYPEFDIWTTFATSEITRALNLDSLESSHPIEVTVHKPSEIDEIFDSISYAKGASIIRMLNDFLTNERFKAGLASYLQKYKYSNAVTANLWESLSEATGTDKLPVAEIMNTWTKQMGFPVVEVSSTRDTKSGKVTHVNLRQRRYLASTTDIKGKEQYWLVPVTVCEATREQKTLNRVVMKPNGDWQSFELPSGSNCKNVKINPGGVGFFHVQYEEAQIPALISLVPHLGPQDRLAIVEDQFALAKCGSISVVNALEMVRGYKDDENYTVWSSILDNVTSISSNVDELSQGQLKLNTNAYLQDLLVPVYKKLGWSETETALSESDLLNRKMLRPVVISLLGSVGNKEVVTEAHRLFESHYNQAMSTGCDNNPPHACLPADLRKAVYKTVLKHETAAATSQQTFNKLVELIRVTDLHEERMRLMGSLGSAPKDMINRVYELAYSDDVKKQDKYWVFLSTITDFHTRKMFWEFISNDWAQFKEKITNPHMMGAVVKSCTQHFVTKERHDQVQQFFTENSAAEFRRNLDQALERIRNNVVFLERNGESLRQFYSKYN